MKPSVNILPVLAMVVLASCGGDKTRFEQVQQIDAAPLAVSLDISATQVATIDLVELRLRVEAPGSYQVIMPNVEANFGEFTLFDFQATVPQPGGESVWEEIYSLEPFLAGAYEIPPLEIEYVTDARIEDRRVLQTDPIPITVTSILPESDEIPELADIAPPAAWPASIWTWLAPTLALAFCAILLAALVERRRKRKTAPATTSGPPPHEIAWRELEALLQENLPAKGEMVQFYTRLTGILRRYIEGRFHIHAPRQTTEEFMETMRGNGAFDSAQQSLLESFFTAGDLAKFAQWLPAEETANESAEHCKSFLRETQSAKGDR